MARPAPRLLRRAPRYEGLAFENPRSTDASVMKVDGLGGFVAKYMGDGVLGYFGYPQAHEDDAERAVRAGLELVKAISDLKAHAPLQTRVGVATKLVVVGDLTGSGAWHFR
jgi:class 3 adenylate cyclase